jgi:hypothetical protein
MTSKLVVLEERFGESELHWNLLSLSFSSGIFTSSYVFAAHGMPFW